jgi:hypothetical protein
MKKQPKTKTHRPESASELYRPSDCRLSANLVSTVCVVSATDPFGRNLGFLDWSRYFYFRVVLNCTHEAEWKPFQTHYFSEKRVALELNLDLWICSQELLPLDYRGGLLSST